MEVLELAHMQVHSVVAEYTTVRELLADVEEVGCQVEDMQKVVAHNACTYFVADHLVDMFLVAARKLDTCPAAGKLTAYPVAMGLQQQTA